MKEESLFLAACGPFLNRFKYFVIGFWILFVAVTGFFAPKFMQITTASFEPPDSSLAHQAELRLAEYFPDFGDSTQLALLITADNSSSHVIQSRGLQNFTFALYNTLKSYTPVKNILGNYAGYYTMAGMNVTQELLDQFVSETKTATIISISIRAYMTDTSAQDFAKWAKTKIEELNTVGKDTHVESVHMFLTGLSASLPCFLDTAETDLAKMDAIVLPLSMLVFAYMLRSFRFLLLPLCIIVAGAAGSFGIMYGVGKSTTVFSTTPSLMMSILIAMTIDYSLFLSTRFIEELKRGLVFDEAVAVMLGTAGYTIMVSGVTLSICFLGLLLFPIAVLSSLGIGCAISLSITILVSLTLLPALLFTFPGFFSKAADPIDCSSLFIWWKAKICGASNNDDAENILKKKEHDDADDPSQPLNFQRNIEKTTKMEKDDNNNNSSNNDDDGLVHNSGWWFVLAKLTVRFPYNVAFIIVLVSLTIPFDMFAFNFTTTDAFGIALPRDSEDKKAFDTMSTEFGNGYLIPYSLVFVPPKHVSAFSSNSFKIMASIMADMAANNSALFNTFPKNFRSLMYTNGISPDWSLVVNCQNVSYPLFSNPFCVDLRVGFSQSISPDKTAAVATIILDWDPVGTNGQDWLSAMRNIITKWENRTGFTIFLAGDGALSLDAIKAVYDDLPVMIGVTCGIVLLVMGIAFRSVTISIRAVFTIGLTIMWVFGFASLIIEHGIFDWLHFTPLSSESKAIYWLMPVITFPIMVGIGLDYDIFLVTRILGYRVNDNYSTKDSIVSGLCVTGRIITAAGVIMAIAFCGLMLSSIPSLNQIAIYLVFSVLFDTFIVRSLLVPSLMSLLDEANWWPGSIFYEKKEDPLLQISDFVDSKE